MKRVRDEDDQEEPPINQWTRLDNVLATHVLAYSWKATYRLALVCKRFLAVTRSRPYWRALAHCALRLKGMPRYVLEHINIFHGLRESDPPHFVLWELLRKSTFPQVRFIEGGQSWAAIVLTAKQTNANGRFPVFEVQWKVKKLGKILMCLHHVSEDTRQVVGFTSTTYIGYRQTIHYVGHYENHNDKVLYCQMYNPERTRVWCGLVSIPTARGDWVPHEPFGQWVDAKDFVLAPVTWDLLRIKN